MDITVTIALDESQLRAIQLQLLRAGTGETVTQLVTRMTQKVINGWTDQNQQEFIERNRSPLEAMVSELAIDPDRDEKLAALGWQFVNGVLTRIPGSP